MGVNATKETLTSAVDVNPAQVANGSRVTFSVPALTADDVEVSLN